MSNTKIVLGVTGCIGAYKSAELVRGLKKRGYDVQVILTRNAQEFVTPLTLETLSELPVITDLFGPVREDGIRHISLTEETALFLVAPCSADVVAKLALGIADDFLTTFALANRAPTMIAPAMNTNMLAHPAVVQNLESLRARGVEMIEPGEGWLACGWMGKGRLAEPEEIVKRVEERLSTAFDLEGVRVLVSAGPTAEPLDPVRVLTNRSSGKMGFRVAERARARGAKVVLVSGPSSETLPHGVEVLRVQTAAEMKDAILGRLDEVDVVIMSAAVADYRPEIPATQKIKKNEKPLTLKLVRTDDILMAVAGNRRKAQTIVGFAAETESLEANAREKLSKKKLDLIVANDVSRKDSGFEVDTNQATVFRADGGVRKLPLLTKLALADEILDEIRDYRGGR
ncbi:MAG TPA: bifunctional phosphopantothenoylcysteine decarboxylase/phosphopantothenate--cysteine ligase CoaBC [Vicinamibacteria bacterium]|nr:bifunctional phosphopantothenoylcysteine decarboxylase/phosphopantothenate--cysteine ligase CoaBC [Vicinamibacteria bacterium]